MDASIAATSIKPCSLPVPVYPPRSLAEGQVARGTMGEIGPWETGLILVCIGKHQIVLPAELEKKLGRFQGCRVEVLRCCGSYTVRRAGA